MAPPPLLLPLSYSLLCSSSLLSLSLCRQRRCTRRPTDYSDDGGESSGARGGRWTAAMIAANPAAREEGSRGDVHLRRQRRRLLGASPPCRERPTPPLPRGSGIADLLPRGSHDGGGLLTCGSGSGGLLDHGFGDTGPNPATAAAS